MWIMLHELVTVNNVSPVKDLTIMDNHTTSNDNYFISPTWSNGGYIHCKENK